jgi:hypothetical protein
VVSRALNNRLKKASGYIFSRAQKGFTKERHIQEVMINVIEMIAHCNEYQIPGAIVCIDQSKAFDSVSHAYMKCVYKFFGFGDNFINTLETLGNNRTACISFDDGSHSAPFELGCGRAQGNTSSPIEYNSAQQILLFKIELSPEIKSVFEHHFIARPFGNAPMPCTALSPLAEDEDNDRIKNECALETSKSDGFADDNTTGTLFEFESLSFLKRVLEDFGQISGLKCNAEKSSIMQVGRRDPIPADIAGLGFRFEESIHILGMDINHDLSNLDSNFTRVNNNLKKGVEHWTRFNLSLQGRINIIKSVLFSQILYLGSFLMPSQQQLTKLQNTLDDFALSGMNYGKKRICLPREEGGMGLFNVEDFLISMQANWVLKAYKSSRDNWRYKLRALCYGNVLCAGPELIKESANPVLFGLATSFKKVRVRHDKMHSNFSQACIVNNPLFFRGPRDKSPLLLSYLGLEENVQSVLPDLTASDFFNVNGLKTRAELRILYQLDLSVEGYGRLARCLNHYVTRLRPNRRNNGSSMSMVDTFMPLKKPGKKIRNTIGKIKRKDFEPKNLQSIKSFLNITEIRIEDYSYICKQISLWNTYGISHSCGNFIFKFFNNILGTNARIFHFVPGINKACTFCNIRGIPNPDPENFLHIFFTCATTAEWHGRFLSKYFPDINFNNDDEKKILLFLGKLPDPHRHNFFIALCVLIYQFCLWEAKLKKKIHSFHTIDVLFREKVEKLLFINGKIRKIASKTNLFLRRTFARAIRVDGPAYNPAGAIPVLPDVAHE